MQYGRIWVTPHFYCQHLHCIHFLVLSKQAKTHFVLLINLAVADLIIGFTEPVAIGTVGIPQRFGQEFYGNVSTAVFLFACCKWNSGFYPLDSSLAYCCILASCLLTIRVTYLIVRRKRNTCRRYPTTVKNHCENRPNGGKHSTKLPRTLFIMIAVSLGQSWSVASKHRIFLCSQLSCHRCVPIPLI